uniref:Uncharacterized protein n=1 Tax=viral metagenome TaxID=1070528 RepID=A0A6M3K861_9ZZZZ
MAKYNPDEDVPYGIAAADFPITFYDRPQLAFANLLRGDIDPMTRAIFSPQTLTPHEIQSFRNALFKGKKPDPILKTITDIATNPLVIMGLVVGLWKFPIGSTKPMLDLAKGMMPKAKAMGEIMSGIHPAINNLRSVPGMYQAMADVISSKTKYLSKQIDKIEKMFGKAGRLSKVEGYAVAAKLDGLDKPTHAMVKMLGNEPEIVAIMGGKDVPIAGGISGKMRKEVHGLYGDMRGWLNQVKDMLKGTPGGEKRVKDSLAKLGLTYGDEIDDYFPRNAQYDKYSLKAIRGTTRTNYKAFMRKEAKTGPLSKESIARTGGGITNLEQLQEMESAGLIPRGYTNAARTVFNRWGDDAALEVEKVWKDVQGLGLDSGRANVEFISRMENYFTKGAGQKLDFAGRFGGKKTAADTLNAMADSLTEARIKGEDFFRAEVRDVGRVMGTPRQYTLDIWDATKRYTNATATTYSWHGTGAGERINVIANKPGVWENMPWGESYVYDDIVPHLMGNKSWQELRRSIWFSTKKAKVHEFVKTHPMVEQIVGKKGKDWLMKGTGDISGSWSAEGAGANISHWFHLSTLGGNISPASKNSLQTLITTLNQVGVMGMYRGLKGVPGSEGALAKMGKYLKMMIVDRKSTKEAFRLAFPEYVADMGEASNIVESLLAGDIAKEGLSRKMFSGAGWKRIWEKVKTGMLMPFATSEGGNRIMSYYAGRNQHLYENKHILAGASSAVRDKIVKEAGKVGQTLTMTTQFTGGPLGIPKALINMWPPWKQFMHFPMRFGAFLHQSLRMGPDPSKLDWGTIGRTMAGSTAMYLGAKNLLGVDISSGLAMGALPIPTYEGSPFYPFPLVPPAVGVIGTGAKALLTGEGKDLGATAALLVPGGIAARKAYRALHPKYADYKNRTPDGRIPIYNNKHALIGAVTPFQLTLKTLGLRPSSVAAEQAAAQWLLAQREKIRAYKRDYLQALSENDNRKAEAVQKEFTKAYPELGPLQIKKSDIRALENRREISRLHRIERGLPSAYRPLFSQILGEASLANITRDIDVGDVGLGKYLQ